MSELTSPEENIKAVKRASFDVFTEGDLSIIDESVADDFILHDPTQPDDIKGREAYKEYVTAYRTAFPDLSAEMETVICEGDLVAVRFSVSGTHEGPVPEAPELEPSGKRFEVSGMEFDRIADGKLTECWQLFDALTYLDQLDVPTTEPMESKP